MAIGTGTFTTYATKGIREDLSDTIYQISPEDTPFMSNAGKGPKAKQTFFEWQTDALAAVDATNAQFEGDDSPAASTPTATKRIGNYQQISRKLLLLSDTDEEVDKAGRKSEEAYQLAKRSSELKRDMETILIGTNQFAVAGNTTTARKTATPLSYVITNVDFDTGAGASPTAITSGAPTDARTDGTQRAFTETILKNVLQLSWASGANVETLMVGGAQKQVVSGFAGIATKTIQQTAAKAATIIGAADLYVSDFGTIAVVPNRFQRNRDAWAIDWSMVSVRYLRNFRRVKLAKTGDATKTMLIVEYGLQVNNEAGLGLAADLT